RKKGFNTLLSLGFTFAAIFAVFIPAILSGKNIYLMSILVCVYTIAMTLLIVIGFNKKSLASVAGCTGGVMAAGIIALVMDRVLMLTGIVDEHSRFLINLPGDIQLNLNAVIFAGIIIGAMGAIMDVAISISSSLWEIQDKAKIIKNKELFRSGLNIGRDIMGSMANTLILAYIGSSLSVVLLLSVFSGSFLDLFNSEMIAVEILQALAGSFGILLAIPLTSFFCSLFYLKKDDIMKS
ncbi:MAG: YibE/F family protein, partial [Treponema sp.]|nr:YibE/F family protein [Treponema sp.]